MLMAEILQRVIPGEPSDEVTIMICHEPRSDAAAVSLIDADPTQSQIPFSALSPHCHDFCTRRFTRYPIIRPHCYNM